MLRSKIPKKEGMEGWTKAFSRGKASRGLQSLPSSPSVSTLPDNFTLIDYGVESRISSSFSVGGRRSQRSRYVYILVFLPGHSSIRVVRLDPNG